MIDTPDIRFQGFDIMSRRYGVNRDVATHIHMCRNEGEWLL